jgi:hypothetical protein
MKTKQIKSMIEYKNATKKEFPLDFRTMQSTINIYSKLNPD